jgi:hypothetical protein
VAKFKVTAWKGADSLRQRALVANLASLALDTGRRRQLGNTATGRPARREEELERTSGTSPLLHHNGSMNEDEILLPSVRDYERAFRAVERKISSNQRKMLEFHHAQPARTVSATKLAEHIGWSDYGAVNVQYGILAHSICRELGIDLGENVKAGVLVDFAYPHQAANMQFLWVMREHVAIALEELGWVPRVSQFLYPDLALKRLAVPSMSGDRASAGEL